MATLVQAPDSVQVEAGKVVKFGVNQLGNPTPKFIKYIFNGALFALGLWALLSGQITNVPSNVLAEINKWSVVALAVMKWMIGYFGWDFKSN